MAKETYNAFLDLWFKLQPKLKANNNYRNVVENGTYSRVKTEGTSHTYKQPIAIMDTEQLRQYNPAECHMIFRIMSDLKEYNPLWQVAPDLKKNTRNGTTIKSLIDKQLLWKSETKDIYVVNPFIIRRGEIQAVITTTLNMLADEPKVSLELITDKRPVKYYTPTNPSNQISYRYEPDTEDNN